MNGFPFVLSLLSVPHPHTVLFFCNSYLVDKECVSLSKSSIAPSTVFTDPFGVAPDSASDGTKRC